MVERARTNRVVDIYADDTPTVRAQNRYPSVTGSLRRALIDPLVAPVSSFGRALAQSRVGQDVTRQQEYMQGLRRSQVPDEAQRLAPRPLEASQAMMDEGRRLAPQPPEVQAPSTFINPVQQGIREPMVSAPLANSPLEVLPNIPQRSPREEAFLATLGQVRQRMQTPSRSQVQPTAGMRRPQPTQPQTPYEVTFDQSVSPSARAAFNEQPVRPSAQIERYYRNQDIPVAPSDQGMPSVRQAPVLRDNSIGGMFEFGLRSRAARQAALTDIARQQNYLQARGQNISAETARRGQDVTAQTAMRGQDVTRAGQLTAADTARAGQQVTREGQQLAAETARRGQDLQNTQEMGRQGIAREDLASQIGVRQSQAARNLAEAQAMPERTQAEIQYKQALTEQAQATAERAGWMTEEVPISVIDPITGRPTQSSRKVLRNLRTEQVYDPTVGLINPLPPKGTTPIIGRVYSTPNGPGRYRGDGRYEPVGTQPQQ